MVWSSARRSFAALTFGAALLAQGAALAQGPAPVADIADQLIDSVVNISTAQRVSPAGDRLPIPRAPEGSPFQDFFEEFYGQRDGDDGPARRVQSLGSGFIIDAAGIVVTNNHVIEDADEITAILNDGTELPATLLGADDKTDLAVLKVEPLVPLTAVPFGDSDALRVGDWVMAIGNPFGLGGSVTLGIVSARNRDINSGPYDNFIQTDASINRGNSGGPLFDMMGRVVGVNTAIISPTGGSIGIGFAVPANTAVAVVDQLRQFGETRRGWLGVRIQGVTDRLAEALGLEEARGALVAGVTEEGPAEEAGILAGDVILTFDGEDVGSEDELPRMVADKPIGSQVAVVVRRDGEDVEVEVTLGRLEDAERIAEADAEAEEAAPPDDESEPVEGPFGLLLSDLTDYWIGELEIAHDLEGVAIVAVSPGSVAEDKRLRPGDVIVEIAQERVFSATEVQNRIDDLVAEGRRSALFLLANKAGDLRFVAITLTN